MYCRARKPCTDRRKPCGRAFYQELMQKRVKAVRQNLLPMGFLIATIGLSAGAVATSQTLWASCEAGSHDRADMSAPAAKPRGQSEKDKI